MKRWLGLGISIMMLALLVSMSAAQVSGGSNWTGEYFNNRTVSGSASVTRTDSGIAFNWGEGSPAPGIIDVDDFSVRWTTTENFSEGSYTFTATIDDALRLYIDNAVVLDEFREGPIRTIQTTIPVTAGSHVIRVEYFEAVGSAQVTLTWQLDAVPTATPTPGPTPTPAPTGLPAIPTGATTATVARASVLLIRNAPFLGAEVVDRVRRGETFQILGRNDNSTWYLLQLSGSQGWAYAYYLNVEGNEFTVPVESAFTTYNLPGDTGVVGQTRAVMKLRALPDSDSEQIGRLPWGQIVPVLGRTEDGEWWQVIFEGTTGWVFASYLRVIEGDLENVPIIA